MISLPYPPSTNHLYRGAGRHRYRTPEYQAFILQCQLILNQYDCVLIEKPTPVAINMILYSRRQNDDIDNRIKAVLDVLQGYAYENDRQIVALCIHKKTDAAKKGTIEVEVFKALGGKDVDLS